VKYLLSISLGPVQEFIAAARRTRDLRYGSWLFSELSKSVARQIDQDNGELIFPFSETLRADLAPGSNYAASNKILAIVDADGEPSLREYAEVLHQTARGRLFDVKDQALKLALRLAVNKGGVDEGRMESQLRDLIEFYAAWTPYSGVEYDVCRTHVDRWAAARKTLRDFRQHATGDKLPKCSLDGIRETVIRPGGLRDGQFFVKANEQLDGIGLVKRFAGENPHFDSTIDVAAGPYLARLSAQKPAELQRYVDYLNHNKQDIPFSYGYLYRRESRSPLEFGEPHASALEQIAFESHFPEPKPPYYAFLMGDGDSMGETIAGIKEKGLHQKFSERLSRFAADVRALAAMHPAWNVVFAGGDDVMALLPLHEALDAAAEFRECFVRAVTGLEKPPTFSVGMVIAHAMEPLSEVRRLAKTAERQAKRTPHKNALAVWAVPRSGAPVKACGPWEPFAVDLKTAVDLYQEHAISSSFAYALRDLLDSTLRRGLDHLDDTLFPLAKALAEKKEAKEPFMDWLQEARTRAGRSAEPHARRDELQRLADLLLVARPIARAVKEAHQ
jgi:CRISPR-associated protein Cmr2